jgi:hypothetical protein
MKISRRQQLTNDLLLDFPGLLRIGRIPRVEGLAVDVLLAKDVSANEEGDLTQEIAGVDSSRDAEDLIQFFQAEGFGFRHC